MGIFSARSFWLPLLTATLVASLFGAVLARRGRQLERLLRSETSLENQLAALNLENARLKAERDALLSSPQAIERVAREEYGFTAPGEKVEPFSTPAQRPAGEASEPARRELWLRLLSWQALPIVTPAATFALMAALLAVWNAATAYVARRKDTG
ncbi:MAG: septum formation initiator family protein [Planctomycetes bacterium]|nr:septum formation initiator family protein [Planctomycetota bacterium]